VSDGGGGVRGEGGEWETQDGPSAERGLDDPEARSGEASTSSRRTGGRPSTSMQRTMARVREVLWVGFPEMASCLVEPLVSTVETMLVGRMGALYLAALGPGTALLALISELCCALAIVATSTVARSAVRGGRVAVQRQMGAFVLVSLAAGALLTVALLALASTDALFSHLDPRLAGAVKLYVACRAVGTAGFMVSNAAEGCFLGLRNAVLPLALYAASGAVTVGLMLALASTSVLAASPDLGFAGLGLASSLGQLLCAAAFVHALRSRKLLRFDRLPAWRESRGLADDTGQILAGAVARMTTYNVMMYAASTLGIVPAAAHKIAYEGYWFMSFLTEPSFTAANALVPREVGRAPGRVAELVRALLLVGLATGLALACAAGVFTRTQLFTSDPAVLSELGRVAPYLTAMIFTSSLVYPTEGIIFGAGCYRYLTAVHCGNCALMGVYSWWVTRSGVGLEAVWAGMFGYQVLRLLQHSVRFAVANPLAAARAQPPPAALAGAGA